MLDQPLNLTRRIGGNYSMDEVRQTINWEVETTPIYIYDPTIGNYVEEPNRHALIRNDTRQVLSIPSKRYVPFTNEESFTILQEMAMLTNGKITGVGTFGNGSKLYYIIQGEKFELIRNDPAQGNYLILNSFDMSMAVTVLFVDIRIHCQNQFLNLLSSARANSTAISLRHTKGIDQIHNQLAESVYLQLQHRHLMSETMEYLSRIQMTANQQLNFISEHIFPPTPAMRDGRLPEDHKRYLNRQEKIGKVMQLVETGKGSYVEGYRGTAYGLFNAFVEYLDYSPIETKASEETRIASSVYGRNMTMKREVFNKLVQRRMT